MLISIPDDVIARLRERAAEHGQTLPAYAAELIAETIRRPSIDEILASARQQVAESGMTDQELDAFLEDARDKAFQSRQVRDR